MFPRLKFPEIDRDLSRTPADAEAIYFQGDIALPGVISTFRNAKRVRVLGCSQEGLGAICALRNVEYMLMWKWIRVSDLSPMVSLVSLRGLAVEHAPGLQSVSPLRDIESLRLLELVDANQIPEQVAACAEISQLAGLSLGGSPFGSVRFEPSLEPLAALADLQHLGLNVKPRDESLEPIAWLRGLRSLVIRPDMASSTEYARLAKTLRGVVECGQLRPYVEARYARCKKCGAARMVKPTGKRMRKQCLDCDQAAILRLTDAWYSAEPFARGE